MKLTDITNKKEAGLYIITSPFEEENNGVISCKIGRSIDLRKRLNSYFTSFNKGYYVLDLVRFTTLKTKKDKISHTMLYENLFKYLYTKLDKMDKQKTRKYKTEWFLLNKDDRNLIHNIPLMKISHSFNIKEFYLNSIDLEGEILHAQIKNNEIVINTKAPKVKMNDDLYYYLKNVFKNYLTYTKLTMTESRKLINNLIDYNN